MVSVHWSGCFATSELLMSISSVDMPVRMTRSTPAFAARSSVDEKSGGWYCLPRYFPWNSSAVAVTAIFSCQHMTWCSLSTSTHVSKPQASSCRRSRCCCWQSSQIDILVCHAGCWYFRIEANQAAEIDLCAQDRKENKRLRKERIAHDSKFLSKGATECKTKCIEGVKIESPSGSFAWPGSGVFIRQARRDSAKCLDQHHSVLHSRLQHRNLS